MQALKSGTSKNERGKYFQYEVENEILNLYICIRCVYIHKYQISKDNSYFRWWDDGLYFSYFLK